MGEAVTPFDELPCAVLATLAIQPGETPVLNWQTDEGECKRMALTSAQLDGIVLAWLKVRLQ